MSFTSDTMKRLFLYHFLVNAICMSSDISVRHTNSVFLCVFLCVSLYFSVCFSAFLSDAPLDNLPAFEAANTRLENAGMNPSR
jgi:hypothetical protein